MKGTFFAFRHFLGIEFKNWEFLPQAAMKPTIWLTLSLSSVLSRQRR
jgi:hypothetical protein